MEQVLLNICLGTFFFFVSLIFLFVDFLIYVNINYFKGDVPSDQFGCASFPDREEDFKKNLDETIKYAKGLECKK